uniref:phage portal protein n=1 Tax=Herbidospora sakaeratensis TaxID=564415 RepID=UPI000784830C|nr:phage portal protein [Herbidospora sakaeratensis]
MSLFGLFERRSNPENPSVPLTSSSLLEWLGGMTTSSGKQVSEKGALAMSAVYRCVGLVAGVSSSVPLHTYQYGTHDRVTSRLLNDPHPELTALEVWRLAYTHRAMWGNAYLQKVRNGAGQVRELWPVTPDRAIVDREKPSDANPSGKYFYVTDDWGVTHRLTPYEILHLPSWGYDGLMGLSPIAAARNAIGLGLSAEEYGAKLFASGNMMGGILSTEQRLNKEQADTLKARWKARVGSGLDNAHDVAVLDSGASFTPVTMPARDSQFLESRTFSVEEIGRWFGVPHFLLGLTAKSTSWGTGLEQQAIGWVKFDLHPTWLALTEARVTKELTGATVQARYKLEGLLRGDSQARADFYRVMRDVGAFSANDIRELEDLGPVEGGDMRLQPLNYTPLGSDPYDDKPAPSGQGGQDNDEDED